MREEGREREKRRKVSCGTTDEECHTENMNTERWGRANINRKTGGNLGKTLGKTTNTPTSSVLFAR